MNILKRFSRCQSGATAIEYGLIAALIALAAIISIQLLGINLADTFTTLASVIGGALGGG
jgi:pilus assembly protein Flp/PilA